MQRQDIYQRELLLDTVIQATPLALVLTNANGAVVYANLAARHLFRGGRKLEGLSFEQLLAAVAARHARGPAERARYAVHGRGPRRAADLPPVAAPVPAERPAAPAAAAQAADARAQRAEVATWKNVIRVIAHEINNSLAPIASLAQSGQRLAEQPDRAQLQRVFAAIGERMSHLAGFVDGYSRFAKLPRPRPEAVDWHGFLESLRTVAPFTLAAPLPTRPGWFDASQIAAGADEPAQECARSGFAGRRGAHRRRAAARWLAARDSRPRLGDERGSPLAMRWCRSIRPSRRERASGLTLCREIVEAHGGTLEFGNRADGGVSVRIRLPAAAEPDQPPRGASTSIQSTTVSTEPARGL